MVLAFRHRRLCNNNRNRMIQQHIKATVVGGAKVIIRFFCLSSLVSIFVLYLQFSSSQFFSFLSQHILSHTKKSNRKFCVPKTQSRSFLMTHKQTDCFIFSSNRLNSNIIRSQYISFLILNCGKKCNPLL